MATDWVAWHDGYDDGESPLARRLGLIQSHIARVLADAPRGPVGVVSMCAGDGRDLLGVLRDHPRRLDVHARLVELNPELSKRGREAAASAGLRGVEVVTADAGRTSVYVGAVPADLVLVCGVFGNIVDNDVRSTVAALPSFTASGATVIWTRHRRPPDLTPSIRRWLRDAGYEEVAVHAPAAAAPSPSRWAWTGVGVHRYGRDASATLPNAQLFSFVE